MKVTKTLKGAIEELKPQIKVLVDVPEDELNTLIPNSIYSDFYDPTFIFRSKVIKEYGQTTRITKLFACYYQGWEMDEWAAEIRLEDGRKFEIETSHGSFKATRIKE